MRRRLRWAVLLILLLVAAAGAAGSVGMRVLGGFLVEADEPAKADMIVVMAGDMFGHRVLKACELVKKGYAPKALIDGPCCDYGLYESELAIRFAAGKGCPAEVLIPFPMQAFNTIEEASKVVPELRRRGVRKFLVVTSNFHTRRTRKAFERFAPAEEFRVVAAPDEYFRPDDWWKTRQAQKVFLLEWSKTLATWIGMGW